MLDQCYEHLTPTGVKVGKTRPNTTPERKTFATPLRTAMETEGFVVYEPEWWHYDYKDWKEYPIVNAIFGNQNLKSLT